MSRPLTLICLLCALLAPPAAAQEGPDEALPPLTILLGLRPEPALVEEAQRSAQQALRTIHLDTRSALGAHDDLPQAPSITQILREYAAPTGPRSVGTTSQGSLLKHATLDPSKHRALTILPRAVPRDTRYGTPAIIAAIEAAAHDVAKHHPGSILAIGNISTRSGGKIIWSRSHQSGRDADLAFYTRHKKTKRPTITPDLFTFHDDGSNKVEPDLEFDPVRNWALARALITSPHAQVQYLFISEGLKKQLLDHARATDEPEWLIERAQRILHQPTDALPHDDHFHLRIYCAPQDRVVGCLDTGARWPWANDDAPLQFAYAQRMLDAAHGPASLRLDALKYLVNIRSPHLAEVALWFAIHDPDDTVRAEARAAASNAWPWSHAALATAQAHILSTRPLDERAASYNILRRSHDPSTLPFLITRLYHEALPIEERLKAARSLEHFMHHDVVSAALDLLHDPADPKAPPTDPALRAEAARLLRRITNRDDKLDWTTASPEQRAAAADEWTLWWREHADLDREQWVLQGFKLLGIDHDGALTADHIEPLINALDRAPEHAVYNINRALRSLTGRWSSLDQRNGKKLQTAWRDWWKQHKQRLLSKRP